MDYHPISLLQTSNELFVKVHTTTALRGVHAVHHSEPDSVHVRVRSHSFLPATPNIKAFEALEACCMRRQRHVLQ